MTITSFPAFHPARPVATSAVAQPFRAARRPEAGLTARTTSAAIAVAVALWIVVANAQQSVHPNRIVCIVPAVTEMLFAIGAGPQVAGVSSFERYPPEALTRPAVGALLDPDVERIISLRPDLVIAYGSQGDLRAQLARAKIPVFAYSHAGLADVTATLREIGRRTGHAAKAEQLAAAIERRIDAVRARTAARPRPRTLIVFGREALSLRGIYASGGVGFVHDIVEAAGGANVFADVAQQAIQASTEQILARRPDVVLELRADALVPERLKRETDVWRALPAVPAVKSGRVHLIADVRTVIPGPRVAEAVELIADILKAGQ
jgi:iron complex transport system substrate-binding protein